MSRGSKFLFAMVVLTVLAIGAFFAADSITGSRRDAALARLRRLEQPQGMVVESTGDGLHTAASSAPDDEQAANEASYARYKRVFDLYSDRELFKSESDEFYRTLGEVPPDEWSDEMWNHLAEWLAKHEDLLSAIRTAANAGGPVCLLDLSQGLSLSLDHVPSVRSCANLLEYHALLAAHQGNPVEAIEDIVTIRALADALALDPILFSHFVAARTASQACRSAMRFLPLETLSRDEQDRLIGALLISNSSGTFRDALLRDARLCGELMEHAAALQAYGDASENWAEARRYLLPRLYQTPLGGPLRDRDLATYIEAIEHIVELSDVPYYEARSQLDELEADLPSTCVYSATLIPQVAWYLEQQACQQALAGVTCLGIAIEGYRADTGAYPDGLSQVADRFPHELPVDPFTGDPFMYSHEEDNFTLYSLGENGQDDGGRDGDIVWSGAGEHDK